MVKGIKTLAAVAFTLVLFAPNAYSQASKHDLILGICGEIKGNVNDYDSPEKVDPTTYGKPADHVCWKIGCRAETGERGGNYDVSVNYRTRCYSPDDLFDRVSGDFDTGAASDVGLGGTIVINGETVTIGGPRWRELCVKEDGSIRGICGGGSGSVSTTGSTGATGNSGSGNGDITISGGLNIPKSCFNIWGNVKKECRIRYGVDKHGNPVGGGVIINGGGNGNNGNGQWEFHTVGNTTFKCAVGTDYYDCIGNDANIIISQSGGDGRHCVDCGSGGKRGGAYGTLSGIAEIAGSVLPPVMGYLGVKAGADAYLGANQAWAGAAATGFEQCQLMQTNYVESYYTDVQAQRDYVMGNGLPDREFGGNMNMPGCNGYQLGGFAGGMGFMGNGMGGFGNPWMGAGYSPGMVGGMYGPYGQYNPYGAVNGMGGMYPGMGGMGMGIGGMGGMYPGMGGMYPGMGGMNPGLGINLGLGTMFPGNGPGMGMGGMGGINCIQAPCPGMGMGGMGGMYPGMGGMNGGIGIGIGMNGGMHGNPWGGGAGGMGVTPWGNGAGSYWNGAGGWGGAGGGAGWGNIQQSYMASNQAYMQDSYLQQAALQNSYQNSARNLWSNGYQGYGQGGMGMNYGYAPYSPGNMGLSLSAGWGFGF